MAGQGEYLGDDQQEQAHPQDLAEGGFRPPPERAGRHQGHTRQTDGSEGRVAVVADEERPVQEGGHRDGDEADGKDDPCPGAGAEKGGTQGEEGGTRHGHEEGGELDREPELNGRTGHG